MRRILVLLPGILFSLVVYTLGLFSTVEPPAEESEVFKNLSQKGITVIQEWVNTPEGMMSVRRVGELNKPKILFVHGSPGDWSNWENMLDTAVLNQHFCLLAIDRPGYGATTVPHQPELKKQGEFAAQVLKHFLKKGEEAVVVGHSYGGAVVEQLGLSYPGLVQKVVSVAGTLSPKEQEPRFYNKMARIPWVFESIPGIMQHSNREMMVLSKGLKENEPKFAQLDGPMVVIQGTDDMLVPFSTVSYLKGLEVDQMRFVEIEGMNHFVPWSDPELIVEAILGN